MLFNFFVLFFRKGFRISSENVSKLIVLGVFLVCLGAVIQITIDSPASGVFYVLCSMAFGAGVAVYREEAEYEIEKKREKDAQRQT